MTNLNVVPDFSPMKSILRKKLMAITNHVLEIAEVSVQRRQELNDEIDKYLEKSFLNIMSWVIFGMPQFETPPEQIYPPNQLDLFDKERIVVRHFGTYTNTELPLGKYSPNWKG